MREAARDYRKLTAVPKELAQREAELESRGYQVGREGGRSRAVRCRRGTKWGGREGGGQCTVEGSLSSLHR